MDPIANTPNSVLLQIKQNLFALISQPSIQFAHVKLDR